MRVSVLRLNTAGGPLPPHKDWGAPRLAFFETWALQFAEKLGFVSGYRFSDTASPSKSTAPLGAGC